MTRTPVRTRTEAQQLADSLRASGMAVSVRERRRDFVVSWMPVRQGAVKLRLDVQKGSYSHGR